MPEVRVLQKEAAGRRFLTVPLLSVIIIGGCEYLLGLGVYYREGMLNGQRMAMSPLVARFRDVLEGNEL